MGNQHTWRSISQQCSGGEDGGLALWGGASTGGRYLVAVLQVWWGGGEEPCSRGQSTDDYLGKKREGEGRRGRGRKMEGEGGEEEGKKEERRKEGRREGGRGR